MNRRPAALLGLLLALTSTPAAALPRSELPGASDSFRGLLGEPGSGSAHSDNASSYKVAGWTERSSCANQRAIG